MLKEFMREYIVQFKNYLRVDVHTFKLLVKQLTQYISKKTQIIESVFQLLKDWPHFIVADDAFPLKYHIMKPYRQRNLNMKNRIYNYHLNRARRIVENAFGIMSARFILFIFPT